MKGTLKKALAIMLSLVLVLAFAGCQKEDNKDGNDSKKPEGDKVVISENNPLTGTSDMDKSAVGKRPLAIVVENTPAARPQWGMGSPDITVEGLVEGGITRMLWLYADVNSIPKVGPNRSARIDFLEIAEGFDAIFTHFGGADTAYQAIYARGVDDIDGNGKGNLKGTSKYFSRDTSRNNRGSEHTAYTKGEWLANALKETGVRTDIQSSYAAPFAFNDKATKLSGGECNELSIAFSSSYRHTFKYNAEKNVYYNYMNSSTGPMEDENGNGMNVTNVIILTYPGYSMIPNTKGSIDMDLSGGTGIVASNGTYAKIKWTKGGPSDMIKITDENGKEFKLNKGKSYIGLIPQSQASHTSIG